MSHNSCRQIQELCDAQWDGDGLSAQEQALLDAHLRECTTCAATAEAMTRLLGRARGLKATRYERSLSVAPLVLRGPRRPVFAWGMGLAMALTMTVMVFALGVRGPPNLFLCSACLTLMWLESSFGICVGCKLYHLGIRWNLIKAPEVMPACPGGACPMPRRSSSASPRPLQEPDEE